MKNLSALITLGCTIFLSQSASAQGDAEKVTDPYIYSVYMSPEPEGSTCPKIGAGEGMIEINTMSPIVGFDKVYFSTEAIRGILQNPGFVGIRFYTALMPDAKNTSVIAVGVNANGLESNKSGSGYYVSIVPTVGVKQPLINKSTAQTAVSTLVKSGIFRSYSVYFSRYEIEELVNRIDAKGIFVMPGSRKFTLANKNIESCPTMLICAAKAIGDKMEDWGGASDTYKKSLEPCPYVCGELTNYLVTPKN